MKTTDDYVREQFLLVYPDAQNIHVETDDELTIRVVVTIDDENTRHFSHETTPDDIEYTFFPDDPTIEHVEFPFMSFIVLTRAELPDAIYAQCVFVADLISPLRLATMMTDDDDYVPAAMTILQSLLAAKFDNAAEIEIDVSELPYDDALPRELIARVKH